MKKGIVSLGMVLVLLVSMVAGTAFADTAEEDSYTMANYANGFLIQMGIFEDQLFTQVTEAEEGVLLFSSDEGEITLACVIDEAGEQVERIILDTQDSEYVQAAMYSAGIISTFRGNYDFIEVLMPLFESAFPDVVAAMEEGKFDSWSSFNPGEMNMAMSVMPQDTGNSEFHLILEWDATEA